MTNAATGLRAKVRPFFSSPWAMFTLALALRLVVMGFAYTIQLDPSRRAIDRYGPWIQFPLP